ncbi:MOSC N-terminal beta barrel domain-containing protein [Reichenbachiella sp. MALMAid0571]|uniref:MOSC domain-containing protein n=1 Tax=Reichenbachiella sp. MALMAid0571 TaxID=3143939 RepID=UPI0032DF920F
MKVTGLTIYPIKSSTGFYANQFDLTKSGLHFDRNWTLIDQEGKVITGRQNAQMLAFHSEVFSDHLVVSHSGTESIKIPFDSHKGSSIDVKIFSSIGYGLEVSEDLNSWFSQKLGQYCRLVVFDPDKNRYIQEKHGGFAGEVVKFADMNPILLISEASLNDLNTKLDFPVSMRNFRPNIVIEGCAAFEEDIWKKIRIGECEFRIAQQCERCVFTTINPDTLEKNKTGEPLKTLAKYRKTSSGGVAFGVHMIPEKLGTVKMNDKIEVLN